MFSMERAWQDTLGMLRTHREGVLAIAGIFAFLPSLAYNLFVPAPVFAPGGANAPAVLSAFLAAWWPALVALVLFSLFGGLAILTLALSGRSTTVASALSKAWWLWLSASGLWLLSVFAAFLGTLLAAFVIGLITLALFGRSPIGAAFSLLALLPAVYLMGRTVHGNALIVAEERRNPWQAFTASIALSKGKGWRIASMFVVIFIVYTVVLLAATALIGIVVALVFPAAAPYVQAVIAAVLAAAMSVVTFLLSGAVYRQLRPTPR